MKICSRCRNEKLYTEFGNNKRQIDGYHYYCKDCTNSSNRIAKYKYRYNKSESEVLWMIVRQEGKCAICGKDITKNSRVDHNHKTNQIRAILCNNCNTGIGMFKEDPIILLRAIEYLMTWNI